MTYLKITLVLVSILILQSTCLYSKGDSTDMTSGAIELNTTIPVKSDTSRYIGIALRVFEQRSGGLVLHMKVAFDIGYSRTNNTSMFSYIAGIRSNVRGALPGYLFSEVNAGFSL